jgi:hypothetical protein
MKEPALDARTGPAVSFAELDIPGAVLVSKDGSGGGSQLDERSGAGVPREELSIRPVQEKRLPSRPGGADSSFRYESAAGEWVGDGKTGSLTGKEGKIALEEDSPERIAVSVEGGGGTWSIEFEAPAGASLGEGLYPTATRAGFQEGADAGFAASSEARGCSELTASFRITEMKRDPDRKLVRFAASFEQRCDDQKQSLKGSVLFTEP